MAKSPKQVTIRTYQVGFGDCFLLSFQYAGNAEKHVLVDFGTTKLPPKAPIDVPRICEALPEMPLEAGTSRKRSGELPNSVIGEIVRKDLSKARACFESALTRDRSLRGRVLVRWWVEPSGKVHDACIVSGSTAIHEKELHRCLIGIVRTFTFPRPSGDGWMRMEYSYLFDK